jgi:transcriptional regulator with XRE-family HTH domain
MVSLITVSKAQKMLVEHTRARRLGMGLTQEGLAVRAGVSLPTLRKFEQKHTISLESFLKLLLVLDSLEQVVQAAAPTQTKFSSIDDVLVENKKKVPRKGWRS